MPTGAAPGGDRLAAVRDPRSLFRHLFDEPDPRRALQEAARIFAGLAGGAVFATLNRRRREGGQ